MISLIVTTEKHSDWKNFCQLLDMKIGGISRGVCPMDSSKPLARKILMEWFPMVDVKKTFKYFEENGGFCDCEILWNVGDDSWKYD